MDISTFPTYVVWFGREVYKLPEKTLTAECMATWQPKKTVNTIRIEKDETYMNGMATTSPHFKHPRLLSSVRI